MVDVSAPHPVPRPGQLYRPTEIPDVLWVVMAVEYGAPFPVKCRRCDAENQTHIGRYQIDSFAEFMERVEVTPVTPPGTRLRVGRKVGRTIYDANDQLIGVMDTPELAAMVVEAVNATAR